MAETDNYTPTTNEVRQGYAETIDALGGMHLGYAQFDRWLAQERAKAKAEELRDAAESIRGWMGVLSVLGGCCGPERSSRPHRTHRTRGRNQMSTTNLDPKQWLVE